MFAITARNLIPIGRVGLRTIATKSKTNNAGFKKIKVCFQYLQLIFISTSLSLPDDLTEDLPEDLS